MRTNDQFPDSGKPLRSARLGEPRTANFANNRLTLRLSRGTYRIQAVIDRDVQVASAGIFYCVGRKDALEQFPAGTGTTTALGEYMVCSGQFTPDATHYYFILPDIRELDVRDGEFISFFSVAGTEVIKYVKVGELPPRDPEVNDNHSGAFE